MIRFLKCYGVFFLGFEKWGGREISLYIETCIEIRVKGEGDWNYDVVGRMRGQVRGKGTKMGH